MKKGLSAVFACVGAVVGAGFASGREIIVFFTQYGRHSWWLILLASTVITWLCWLCMTQNTNAEWAYGEKGTLTVVISGGLMIITSGAMIAASGNLIALLWPNEWAYAVGAVATALLAWGISRRSVRILGWISAVLSILLVCVLIAMLGESGTQVILFKKENASMDLLRAGVFAASYASMNMMLAAGVISRCTGCGKWVPGGVGLLIGFLLWLSNILYSKHPELMETGFPLISLLSRFGRSGFMAGIALMYLSVLTTLISVFCGLRKACEQVLSERFICTMTSLGLPLLVACAGFTGIVDRIYAPAGFACLILIFVPMQIKHFQNKQGLDF